MEMDWDFDAPYVLEKQVSDSDIDVMGHTNNVVYLKWLENLGWQHSESIGLGWDLYQKLNRGMVARRHELDYLVATFAGDDLLMGTWVIAHQGKTGLTRAYQIIRRSDYKTVLRGRTHWVCVDIKSGKPRRMPVEFIQGYKITPVKAVSPPIV